MVPRISLVAILIIACSLSCVVEAFKVVQGDKNVVLLDLTLVNGTTISSIELASSYAWISRVMTDPKEEFTANIIALDVPEDVPCSIANPRAVTEGQIGIVRITRRTTRQNYVNTCSSFQLVAAAQRENAMQAVILIRNDSRLNNEYEAGNFLAGTTYAIFTEQKAFDTIIELYGGEQNIMRMAAKILVAPDDVIAPWQEHVVRVRSMAAVATVLSGISLIWAVILLPFRQKYYPLNSKTLLVFLTFIGIIILAALRVAVYPVDFRGYQAVYTSLGFQFIVFAGDTMVALVFSVVVVAWLEISLWKSKKRVSRILRICCLALNLALLICLFVTVIIDSIDPTLGAVSAGNIILAVFLLIIVIGFMVAGGRLLHLMKKIKDSKTERDGKDKVLKKKIAIVLTVIGVIGFYAVAANIIANLLPLNADINMGIEFSLRFAENIALWIMLWFFTDSIVHHIDSSRGSISSGKAKSAMSSRKINTSTGVVAGTSTLPSQGEIENH